MGDRRVYRHLPLAVGILELWDARLTPFPFACVRPGLRAAVHSPAAVAAHFGPAYPHPRLPSDLAYPPVSRLYLESES